jgi:hypothetical protein
MITAIVLASESQSDADVEHAHEIVVRSLVWLVSAVVSGVVRDVILAAPPGFGLSEVADQSGCALVQGEEERDRIAEAVAAAREPRLLFLRVGYQIDPKIAEEIDVFVRREPADASALIVAMPETARQRLFPGRTPVIGAVVSRATMISSPPESFARLVRASRKGKKLRTRAIRIV